MNILFLGEITGKSGIFAVKEGLTLLSEEYKPDLVIANIDSASGGRGIGQRHAVYLHKIGIQVFTAGDSAFSKKDVLSHMEKFRHMVRPANLSIDAPGKGVRTYYVEDYGVTVINLVGQGWHSRIFADDPFRAYQRIVHKVKNYADIILVDFHARSTAEKQTMLHVAVGQATAVIGTGQKVQTNDARIVKNTAYITDAGRCGSADSVSGLNPDPEIRRLVSALPTISEASFESLQLQGVSLEIDDKKVVRIIPFRFPVPAPLQNKALKEGE